MHPTKSIKNQKSTELENKKITLGVTGSIAAIMSIKLSRELIRHGAEVQAVMTESAKKIINPMALKYATGNKVITELTGDIEHVREVGEHGESDLYLIAPATANTISKIASGIDDTTVTTFATTALSTNTKVMIAPAMHESMINQSIVSEKIDYLKDKGIKFVGPRKEEDKAKLSSIRKLVFETKKELTTNKLANKKILITAGPTYTELDKIRILTNKSTGKTGKEIANEALKNGAQVTFIHGEIKTKPPASAENIYAPKYKDFKKSVIDKVKSKDYDYLISAAAISDFNIKETETKFSSKKPKNIALQPTEKIIKKVKEISPNIKIISFKLDKNHKKIKEKTKEQKQISEMVIGNRLDELNASKKTYYFIQKEKEEKGTYTKKELANKLINFLYEKN